MKKVVYSIRKVRNSDEKLSGLGFINDEGTLFCKCISKNGKQYTRAFDDVDKHCFPVFGKENEYKGYVTMYYEYEGRDTCPYPTFATFQTSGITTYLSARRKTNRTIVAVLITIQRLTDLNSGLANCSTIYRFKEIRIWKFQQKSYIAFATNINGLQAAIARNTKNYLRKTDKERALQRLQRLSGFARSDTKKKTF